jgi:hypothetical protein
MVIFHTLAVVFLLENFLLMLPEQLTVRTSHAQAGRRTRKY